MALITYTDVATSLGVTFTSEQQGAVIQAIDLLVGRLEQYLRRPVTSASRTETATAAELAYASQWFLKFTPVHSVTSLTIGTRNVEAADYQVFGWGIANFGSVTGGNEAGAITYVGGLDGANTPAINAVLLEAAKRVAVRTIDETQTVDSLNVDRYQVSYTHSEGSFTPEELSSLDSLRRRQIGGRFSYPTGFSVDAPWNSTVGVVL
jgi:hypothetical protein